MKIFVTLLASLCACCGRLDADVSIQPADSRALRFAAEEIERAANAAKQSAPDVTLSVEKGSPQSYRIERDGGRLRVIGGDETGAMYGGLE